MRPNRLLVALAALAVAVLGAAVASFVARAGSSVKTITVTEKEFHITPSVREGRPRTVRLVVKNTGNYPHALEIKGAGVDKRTAVIKPGKSAVADGHAAVGVRYALWCPVPGHAARGMKATVSLAAAAAATTTGATTTTTADTTTSTVPIPGY